MAKQRGPVASTFTGRVGNVVGAKMKGGEYVTRSYQPSVKNPNTLRQRVSRLRMATASQIAAKFKLAIQAGYGLAAGSTKMYPRNMFVRDIVPFVSGGLMQVQDEKIQMDWSQLKLSKAIGINSTPVGAAVSFATAGKVMITDTTVVDTGGLGEGQLGLVVVIFDELGEIVYTDFGENYASVEVTVPANMLGLNVNVYAFYKWVPKSKNDVSTTEEPWKYPAATSATELIGTGTILAE